MISKKLDKYTSALILGWIEKNLEGCKNSREHGKGLTANRIGQYKIASYFFIFFCKKMKPNYFFYQYISVRYLKKIRSLDLNRKRESKTIIKTTN